MDNETMKKEIAKWQQRMVELASAKKNTFTDPDVYKYSCIVDKLIVEYMKMRSLKK